MDVDDEGYCNGCGKRICRPASDHREEELSPELAAVSDRGLIRSANEDRFALVQGPCGAGIVVCDGVSTTRTPDVAAGLVASVLAEHLQEALTQDPAPDERDLVLSAITAASEELTSREAGHPVDDRLPSTTVVVAYVAGDRLTVGWAGDSRAYWVTTQGALQLTRDHSARNDISCVHANSQEPASRYREEHAITRWLGADGGGVGGPEVVQQRLTGEGSLVLCTDGLWNYMPDTESFFAVWRDCTAGQATALDVAQSLIRFANRKGGHDNVTVALLRLPNATRRSDDLPPTEAEQTRDGQRIA